MTPTDLAASAAIGLSVMAMMACIVTIPVVFQKGASIQNELYDEMSEFKTITDGAWSEIMVARSGILKPRQARQSEHCHCYDRKRILWLCWDMSDPDDTCFREPVPTRTTRCSRRTWRAW